MSANKLILWMSAKGSGSWPQFRAAVEELRLAGISDDDRDDDAGRLALSIYQRYRLNLQRLGHAEFFAPTMECDWRVAPPTLALTSFGAQVRAVVTGARSAKLIEQLRRAPNLNAESFTGTDAPDVFRFSATHAGAFLAFAGGLRFHVQLDAARMILSSLPSITEPRLRRSAERPFGTGWSIERFSPSALRWRTATHEDVASSQGALFRFSLRHQRLTLFCDAEQTAQIPAQVGKYLALRRSRKKQVLSYDRARTRLVVPASCRPPFLIERALIACSGLLPEYRSETRSLSYYDVPVEVAQLAGELLKQDLR